MRRATCTEIQRLYCSLKNPIKSCHSEYIYVSEFVYLISFPLDFSVCWAEKLKKQHETPWTMTRKRELKLWTFSFHCLLLNISRRAPSYRDDNLKLLCVIIMYNKCVVRHWFQLLTRFINNELVFFFRSARTFLFFAWLCSFYLRKIIAWQPVGNHGSESLTILRNVW